MPLSLQCPKCRLIYPLGNSFCAKCGNVLTRPRPDAWWKQGKFLIPAVIGIVIVISFARNSIESEQRVTTVPPIQQIHPVISIPNLANKSPQEIEAILGRSVGLTKITNEPDRMPGEYRDYKIEGVEPQLTFTGLMVRFYRGRAVHFSLDLPVAFDTAQDALLAAGINVGGTSPKETALLARRWSGRYGGVDFKDVAAIQMGFDGKGKYNVVQAEVNP
jgi:hypothetical protein